MSDEYKAGWNLERVRYAYSKSSADINISPHRNFTRLCHLCNKKFKVIKRTDQRRFCSDECHKEHLKIRKKENEVDKI